MIRLYNLIAVSFLFTVTTLNAQKTDMPVPVKIVAQNNGYSIFRGGEPYFIKGAGGTSYTNQLVKYGGNSIRTWDTRNAAALLTNAYKLGLTVTMGLYVGLERHGFNYNDTIAVKKQLEQLRIEVNKYKNYPALLIWGIGNELNLAYTNPKVWDAVNDIAKMIHEEDPNHLVTTMLAGIGKKEIVYIKNRCTSLDLISVQVYGQLAKVPAELLANGWKGPYMVTEWGPTGHWEVAQTVWNASIEETSSQKAGVYQSRYEASIKVDKHCVGSYVFLWGQKQERTPTWYGLFTEKGEESEVVDVMQYEWTGTWPAIRAPHIEAVLLDNKKAIDNIYLQPGKDYKVSYVASDPNGYPISSRWELLPESTDLKNGGDRESRPQAIASSVTDITSTDATIHSPLKEGAYRIFIYVTNGFNKVATANIPFYVKGENK
jgi:hypothetical protein